VERVPVALAEHAGERDRIDRVDHKAAAGTQSGRDPLDDALVVEVFREVPERREEVDDSVEDAVVVELAHVELPELHDHLGLIGGRAGELERTRAQIDPCHAKTAPRELDAMSPAAAGDVEHRAAECQPELLDEEVDLAQRQVGVGLHVVEPTGFEEAVVPARIDVSHAVRVARPETISDSTDVSASISPSLMRARSAAASA